MEVPETKVNGSQHQYTRNLQRIFQQESNFRFVPLHGEEEEKELLNQCDSEEEDDTLDEIDEPEAVHRRVDSRKKHLYEFEPLLAPKDFKPTRLHSPFEVYHIINFHSSKMFFYSRKNAISQRSK